MILVFIFIITQNNLLKMEQVSPKPQNPKSFRKIRFVINIYFLTKNVCRRKTPEDHRGAVASPEVALEQD